MLAFILAILTSALAAAPADAASAGHVVTEPDWRRRPTNVDLRRVLRDAKRSGFATIRCKVNVQGKLYACLVMSETPPGSGAGAAVLDLAPYFDMKPKTVDGKPVDGGVVTIPFNLDLGGPALRYLNHPVWVEAPTAAEVRAAFPAGAEVAGGRASLDCVVLPTGRLDACKAVEEAPDFKGFGRAALPLAQFFRADPGPELAPQRIPLHAAVSIAFDRSPSTSPYLAKPSWLSRPAAEQALSVFPALALKAGLKTGRAVIDCGVGEGGVLTGCRVTAEEPAALGFAEAVLKLTAYMKLAAWTEDGRPTAGARLQMPIRLNAAPAAETPAKP